MHGRVKVRTSAEEQERKRKEKEKKAKLYKAGIDQLFAKRHSEEIDDEILVISAQLLSANPDITTVWNIRREFLLHLLHNKDRNDEELQVRLQCELQLTEQCLRANPKSYGAWHHRHWVLDHMPKPGWEKELLLCNKYLELDERNFHCWDYRRFVVERSKVPASEEFEYTTKRILANFSNYSSWHYRSQLLPCIFPDLEGKRPIQEDKHKEELELVHNAAFTDPNDQSAWFYQRWLLGRKQQPLLIALAEVSQDNVCITLTQSIFVTNNKNSGMNIELLVNDKEVPVTWSGTNGHRHSQVWVSPINIFHLEEKLQTAVVTLTDGATTVHQLPLEKLSLGVLRGYVRPQFSACFSESITSVLQCELDSCTQLLDLEPDSKWTLLTTVLLMQAIDRTKYKEDTFDKLSQLLHVDKQRTGYYQDLRSRYKMEYAIDSCNMLDEGINLSHLGLASLYHCQYLSCFHTVDLSHNNLTSRSLPQLQLLQCCQVLILDDNDITALKGMPALRSLQKLMLQNNHIKAAEEIKFLEGCCNLVAVSLAGNLIKNEELMKTLLPSVNFLT